MKRSRILLFVLVLSALLFTLLATSTFAENVPKLTIKAHTLDLKNAVFMNFKVQCENVTNKSDVKLLVWEEAPAEYKKGTEAKALSRVGVESDTGYLVFRYTDVAAKEMTKQIYVCAYVKVGNKEYYSDSVKFSIIQYAYNMLHNESTDPKLAAVLTNMLEYGAAAQIYFDYNTDFLATDEVAKVQAVNGTHTDGKKTGYYKAGTSVTLTADQPKSGKAFDYWQNSAGEIVGRESMLTIPSCVSETYTAVYRAVCEATPTLEHTEKNDSGLCSDCNQPLGTYDLEGKVIVNFGDSIFGNARAPIDISTFLANHTLATVYNVGFGGCRMSSHSYPQYDTFGMYRLAYAIAYGDWSLQDEAIATEVWQGGKPAYFANSLALLKSIDFNKVDIVTIAYGTNDFTAGRPVDAGSDSKDVHSFAGALRYSIETLQQAYPHLEIVLCTPTYRFKLDDTGAFVYDSDSWVIKEQMLSDFAQKIKDVANDYALPCIDNYTGVGFNYDNKNLYFPAKDGTHPNELGRQKIAKYMAQQLYTLFG